MCSVDPLEVLTTLSSFVEMTGIVDGPSPSELLVKDSTAAPSDAVVFVGISLALGIASRHLLRGTRVPYTVALLIIGIGLGSLGGMERHGLSLFDFGIHLWGLMYVSFDFGIGVAPNGTVQLADPKGRLV
ncbi:hypothetical protein NE237_021098 [Protea cynaroides]|uniref:Cation/H+ exchanger domain-containing protein n=1 Tax=Protea cynaroides TaxID=273540 RepID=A0A9Q0K4J7_9MAGN|nr:hypothetical protein NE237_021098 [Protea cynaroides]